MDFENLKDQVLGFLQEYGLEFNTDTGAEAEMDLDFFKTLISDFDLMAILPDLADVMNWIVIGVNLALVIGPVLLAVMGIWYLLFPSREANYVVGYRFLWGMGSVRSWKFSQRLAGFTWMFLGGEMARYAYEHRAQLQGMETIDLMYTAIEVIIKQAVLVILANIAVNAVIFLLFNFKGNFRWLWRFLARMIKKLFLFLGRKIKELFLFLWYKVFPKKEGEAENKVSKAENKPEKKAGRFSRKAKSQDNEI